jgi:hypothetical protein
MDNGYLESGVCLMCAELEINVVRWDRTGLIGSAFDSQDGPVSLVHQMAVLATRCST